MPYKAVSTIITDILGGRLDATLGSFISLQPHVAAGKLRLLGVACATRAPNYPQYPTIAETVPGFTSGGWFGIVAPAGMSKDSIALLNREINRAMTLPDVREKMNTFGLEIHTEPPEFFTETLRTSNLRNIVRPWTTSPKLRSSEPSPVTTSMRGVGVMNVPINFRF